MRGTPDAQRLLHPVDPRTDHVRGGDTHRGRVTVVIYGDFLCPYCRRLGEVLSRLRRSMGERLAYAFRHFPNERAHPGSELVAIAAEAAGRQGRFWDMYDAIYAQEPPLDRHGILKLAALIGLDTGRFERDLDDPRLRHRVQRDLDDGRRNGVTATPTIFVDGIRYDGAWDYYSMIEVVEPPVGAQVKRRARAFANLPASAALAVLFAAAVAIICANSPLKAFYDRLVNTPISIGPAAAGLSLTLAQWSSEGLFAVFYGILGLEIRREMTIGSLRDRRAAITPLLAGVSGIAVPAAAYLALNPGATAAGWFVPADTGIAFTLGVLAVFGVRASSGLRAFVSAYAISNDMSATLIFGVLYAHTISLAWLIASVAIMLITALFGRWRVYAIWPYVIAFLSLWLSLHLAGVSGALAGLALAFLIPTRPTPAVAPLLAQAASALAELEHVENELKRAGDADRRLEEEPVWDWAARNLRAATDRLQSPAERVERATGPWSTYFVLPIFAFTAAGISLVADFSAHDAPRVFFGVVLALAVAKPLGILFTTWAASRAKVGLLPADVAPMAFLGAAILCGISDPFAFYVADLAFPGSPFASTAQLGALVGSGLAILFGATALALSPALVTDAR